VSALGAPLTLVAARARHRPGRWVLPALGLALATAFAVAVAAEGVIAGDRAARAELAAPGPSGTSVRVTWQGPVTSAVDRRVLALLHSLGLPAPTRVVLLNPVRLGGRLVRPAAISPLRAWTKGAPAAGPCTVRRCAMLVAAGGPRAPAQQLRAVGIDLAVRGTTTLRSAAPLGFVPVRSLGYPLLLTGDVAGLASLPGLSGIFRSQSWLTEVPERQLQSWQLSGIERRLRQAQQGLIASGSQLSMSAPFLALDQARAQAAAAPRHLLAAGGGALALLGMFVVLAAYGLRREQAPELGRLRRAGARSSQRLVFVLGEAAGLSAIAVAAGAVLGAVAAGVLAHRAALPAGAVLDHSLLSARGLALLAIGWLVATGLTGVVLIASGGRVPDVLALVAAAALGLALARGASAGGTLALLVAPLTCVAGGVLVYRGAAALLRVSERLSRRGPVPVRLAVVGLARAPVAASLAIAFIAVSTGLAGFALAYRATLVRGTADQAADQVPLDATVAAGPSFTTPLQMASIARWQALTHGAVLSVRRTYATFTSGASTVTVPALGIPAGGLGLIHGWRGGDGQLDTLARRLRAPGPVRTAGPILPKSARTISLTMSAGPAPVVVSADLRRANGAVSQVTMGTAGPDSRALTATLPVGGGEFEALELDEPNGERATTGHQLAENPASSPQFATKVGLGAAIVASGSGRVVARWPLSRWVGVGAATGTVRPELRFTDTGEAGLVRPRQPSDARAVPILVDPLTAAASSATGELALTVDGLPVTGRVVGVLRRFPSLPTSAAGFVVADQATLSAALDASLPGQGRPDELWIDTVHRQRLAAALARPPLDRLTASWRMDIQRALRNQPVAAGTLGTLTAAAGLGAALAVAGLLAALVGPLRDAGIERDLSLLGLGPRALRSELRVRFLVAAGIGVIAGLVLAAVLTGLTVGAVRSGAGTAPPRPPLVAVAPWGELLAAAAGLVAVLAVSGWAAVAALRLAWRAR
jgi:hypothetical protein